MKTKAIFYHAGMPSASQAEHSVANALNPAKYSVESVHLGTSKARVKRSGGSRGQVGAGPGDEWGGISH